MIEPVLNASSSFLLKRFNRFYREVLLLRRRILRGELPIPESEFIKNGEDGDEANRAAEPLVRQLAYYTREIDELEDTLNRHLYREAQYIMIALADEVFLNFEWAGRDYWREHLLEEQLFHSQHAGEWFFRNLDDLLLKTDRAYTDLAKVYLMALAMGFQGKYRGRDKQKPLSYLRRTYEFIFQREGSPEAPILFPQAYSATLDQGKAEYLPGSNKTKVWLLVACIVFLMFNHFAWFKLSAPILELTKQITTHELVKGNPGESKPSGSSRHPREEEAP